MEDPQADAERRGERGGGCVHVCVGGAAAACLQSGVESRKVYRCVECGVLVIHPSHRVPLSAPPPSHPPLHTPCPADPLLLLPQVVPLPYEVYGRDQVTAAIKTWGQTDSIGKKLINIDGRQARMPGGW